MRTKAERSVMILGVVIIVVILGLFIPTIRQGHRLTSGKEDRKEVVYDGATEDTGNTADTTSVKPADEKNSNHSK